MLPCCPGLHCHHGPLVLAIVLLVSLTGHASVGAFAERKISVVTALLPPAGHTSRSSQDAPGAQLRIEAFGGCYQWSSQREDLIKIHFPDPSQPGTQALFGSASPTVTDSEAPACQPVAVLRSIAPDVEGTQKVIVSAHDKNAPSVRLYCEVYISRIARIKVETTVRSINIGDVETLSVKAYDAQNNLFSSLEGLMFRWSIDNTNVLKPPSIADSEFKLSPARHALALKGADSDMLLVRGVETGITQVSAALLDMNGGSLQAPKIRVLVKELFSLSPEKVRIPPMARVQLHLKVVHGRHQPLDLQREVRLPSPYIHWTWQPIEGGNEVLSKSPDTGIFIALREGAATVTVHDNRVPNNTATASVHVVHPAKLRLVPALLGRASPGISLFNQIQQLRVTKMQSQELPWHDRWVFVQGHIYVLKLEMLDSTSQSMGIPLNFRISVDVQPDAARSSEQEPVALKVIEKTESSNWVWVQAQSVGSGTISYQDAYINHEGIAGSDANDRTRWYNLRLTHNFIVYEQVHLPPGHSEPLLLPPGHSFNLDVRGGSNGYLFSLQSLKPPGVVSVSHDGTVQAARIIGSAVLVVSDRSNLANNLTLLVLVREVGSLILKTPKIQLQLPTTCPEDRDEACTSGDVRVPIPVHAQPELIAGDDPAWRQLYFWSCGHLPGVIHVETSNHHVAEAKASGSEVVGSSGVGICDVISVVPKKPGEFKLSATLKRMPAEGRDLSVCATLQVYAPLSLKYEFGGEWAATDHMHIMPCSSAMLRLVGGPGQMSVPGRVFQNLTTATESTHVKVNTIPGHGFEVVCLRPTPGKLRLLAEVRHEPYDQDVHGDPVVARAWAFLSCAAPSAVHIVPVQQGMASRPVGPATHREGVLFGLRQGQVHQFTVHFSDLNNAVLDNASAFTPDWSLDSTQAGNWLSVDSSKVAVVTVPSQSNTVGTSLALQVVANPARMSVCTARYALAAHESAALSEGMAALRDPLRHTLQLRVTADFLVRWPGYPGRHFAFNPQWVFTFEASYGSGMARLAFNDSLVRCRYSSEEEDCTARSTNIAEVLDDVSDVCSTGRDCLNTLPAKPSTPGATKWFMHPLKPGYVQVVVQDVNHLGFLPEVTEISFLPVGRIALSLSRVAGDVVEELAVLIVRGVPHHLDIGVFDTAGNRFDPDNYQPIGLRVNASDPRLSVEWMSDIRSYSVVGTSLGIFDLQVIAYNHPGSPVYSNILRVNVFEQFGIEPKTAVVKPGQTFEFTFQGGPASAHAESARVEFSSSATSVAQVRENDGHLLAVSPGRTQISARLIESGTARELAQVFAEVEVVVPDGVSIELIEFGSDANRVEKEHPVVLVQDSCDPLRFVAALQGRGLVLTKSLLTVPLGAAEQRADKRHGCSFSWSSSDSTVSITPVGSADALGAAAVDILAGDSLDGKAEDTITISVKVSCPATRQLFAERSLPVRRLLDLRSPVAETRKGTTAFIQVPQFGHIPLSFSRNHGHLDVQLLKTGSPALAEVRDLGTNIELLTDAREGDVQVRVRDTRESSAVAPLTVTAAIRTPRSVRVLPALRQLPLHATAELRIVLAGTDGTPMALSTDHVVEHSISHKSVLESQLKHDADGEAWLRLRGTKEGCSAVNVTVQVRRASEADNGNAMKVSLGEMLLVCVAPGVLVGKSPLLVSQGADVHLSTDTAALGAPEKQRTSVSFSIRLLAVPGGQSTHIGSQIAADLGKLLSLPPESVSVKEVHWSPYDQKRDSIASGPDVDFEVDLKALDRGMGFTEIAELLWFHPELRSMSSPLRFLDLRYGVRAPLGSLAHKFSGTSRCSRQLRQSACAGKEGWVSSAPSILSITGPLGAATAVQPGQATAKFCFDGVSAEADLIVSSVGEIQTEVMSSGSSCLIAGSGRTVASNKLGESAVPLVVFLRFFTSAGYGVSVTSRELLSGPFYSQNIHFVCEPAEATLRDFFDFDVWSFWNVSSVTSLAPSSSNGAGISGGPAPQAACVLHPKRVDANRWKSTYAPANLRLRVFVLPAVGASVAGASAQKDVELPFVPQFAVIDAKGKQLGSGDVGAVLSLAEPLAKLIIWTGGHPVEASLVRQLTDSWRGSIALHLSAQPGLSSLYRSSAELTATVVWESSRAWGGREEVDLRLESRSTGQVEIVRIQVDGSSSGTASPGSTIVESPEGRGSNLRLLLLLLVLALAGWWCVGPMWIEPQIPMAGVPTAPMPPPATVFPPPAGLPAGAYNRGSFSQSPFQRVDLRYY